MVPPSGAGVRNEKCELRKLLQASRREVEWVARFFFFRNSHFSFLFNPISYIQQNLEVQLFPPVGKVEGLHLSAVF